MFLVFLVHITYSFMKGFCEKIIFDI